MVLAEYGHLENIPLDPEQWNVQVRGAARLATALADGMDDALLFRHIATLRTDVPLTETFEDLEWRGARRDELTALCEEIGDTRFPDRVPRWRSP